MAPVVVTGTLDRSVLGIMVDFARSLPYYIAVGDRAEFALHEAEALLAETPCYSGKRMDRVIFPTERALSLLAARWGSHSAS